MSISQLTGRFGLADASTLAARPRRAPRRRPSNIADPDGGIARKFRITEEANATLDADRARSASGPGTGPGALNCPGSRRVHLERFSRTSQRLDGQPWPQPIYRGPRLTGKSAIPDLMSNYPQAVGVSLAEEERGPRRDLPLRARERTATPGDRSRGLELRAPGSTGEPGRQPVNDLGAHLDGRRRQRLGRADSASGNGWEDQALFDYDSEPVPVAGPLGTSLSPGDLRVHYGVPENHDEDRMPSTYDTTPPRPRRRGRDPTPARGRRATPKLQRRRRADAGSGRAERATGLARSTVDHRDACPAWGTYGSRAGGRRPHLLER